jgi:hypothetical protein
MRQVSVYGTTSARTSSPRPASDARAAVFRARTSNPHPRLLAFLNAITKCGGFKSIPDKCARNACWCFLASLLGFVFPSSGTRNVVTIFLNTCRNIPQTHGYIVIAFHLKVFAYRLFIFSQRKAWCKRL